MPEFLARFVDQLNPLNSGNVALYFATLFVYVFTAVSLWLSNSWAWRLACFILNQLFSVGVVISWTLVLIITYQYWPFAIAMVAAALAAATVPRFVSHRRDLRRKYYF